VGSGGGLLPAWAGHPQPWVRRNERESNVSLTEKRVQRLVAKGAAGKFNDGKGLYLVIESKRSANWTLRYQINHRKRWMGLGSARVFTLKQARERAKTAREQITDGIDPVIERQRARADRAKADAEVVLLFRAAAQLYFDQHEGEWRNRKHRSQVLTTLKTYAFPVLGNMNVAAIETEHVLRVLKPIWADKTETASRVRQRIEKVLDMATVLKKRTGDNPARWRGNLDQLLPKPRKVSKVEHLRALPYDDLPAFMAALRQRKGVAARALEFAILTAARTEDVISAPWREIDFSEAVWKIPAERMKRDRQHEVPLPRAAVDLLHSLYREDGNEFIFIGPRGRGLSNNAMTQLLKRMAYGHLATTHGFRSTFKDWCRDRTRFENYVSEAALAHATGDKVEAAYARSKVLDKRRRLMEAWAKFCASAPAAKSGPNVVPLHMGVAS